MRPTRRPRIVGLVLLLLFAAGCDYVERASVDTAGRRPQRRQPRPLDQCRRSLRRLLVERQRSRARATTTASTTCSGATCVTNTTTRVSVDTAGGNPNGESFYPSISGDGRYVAFASSATDLVAGDGSAVEDIFVRDLQSRDHHPGHGRHRRRRPQRQHPARADQCRRPPRRLCVSRERPRPRRRQRLGGRVRARSRRAARRLGRASTRPTATPTAPVGRPACSRRRRSTPTAPASCSSPPRATSCRWTATGSRTCSCAT